MTDTVIAKGGKHATLWERMRTQKRPQMIHRCKSSNINEAPTKEASKETIPIAISMTSSLDDESELMGIRIPQEPSTVDGDKQETQTVPYSLDTSFISASTQEEISTAILQDDILGTPAAKHQAPSHIANTPKVLWDDWQQHRQQQHEQEAQSGHLSLLEQSMISNDSSSQDKDETKLSVASLADSSSELSIPVTPGHGVQLLTASSSPTTPLTAMRQNSMDQALQESHVYIKRIQELEQALRMATTFTSSCHRQSTPSNFSSVDALPSPLLERNKTLIKEVKFAEQTCVELSQRNVDMEFQVDRLEQTLFQVTQEKDGLHQDLVQSNRDCATLQAEKNALQVTSANQQETVLQLQEQLKRMQQENEQLRAAAVETENCHPHGSPNSNNNKSTERSSISSPTSQVLAKTLRTQLERGYSDNDKLMELEAKLTESQMALQETRRELEVAREQLQSSPKNNNNNNMLSELELARAQAKLASLSKELQMVRVAESSARHALSQAKVELNVLQREKEALLKSECLPSSGDPLEQVAQLQATVEKLTTACRQHETAAFESSNRIKNLEDELLQSRRQVVLQREHLQQEFFEMTQQTLGNVERQSVALDRKVKARTDEFKSKIKTLSFAIQHLQDSLDFQSETNSSVCEGGEEETLSSEHSVERIGQARGVEDSSHSTVLNATFHQPQSGVRSFHEEMLLEQMEEARPVDEHAESAGHEIIDDLSFIGDMSHLYEDLSALLMHDPTSPGRNASAGLLQMTPPAIKSTGNVSSAEKSSVQLSLDSVEHDFLHLRAILERAHKASSQGNDNLLGTIDEQTSVIHSLELKLCDFANEAGKIEAERRQLNVAVLEMSKAYERCQAELKDTSEKLKASKDAEAEVKSEIQQTLQGLLGKLQEKEGSIAELQSEKERLSATIRHLTVSSEELLRNREDMKSEQVEKLQRKLESAETQLAKERVHCEKLEGMVESLENLQQQHVTTISNLEESNAVLEAAKSEIEDKYHEATSILRALSREREQHKKELHMAKRREEEIRREVTLGAETISVQREQLEKMKVERDDARTQSTKLSRTVDQLTTARSELLLEVEQLKRALSTVEGELDYLKVSYITCNDKLADVSERNANKDEIVEKFRSSNRAAKEAISTYEERLALLNGELEKSESKRKVLKQQLVAMEKQLEAKINGFTTYKSAMEEKLSERHDLIEVIQSTAEALKCTYEHKLAALTAEHEALEAEVNQCVSDFINDFRAAFSDSLESLSLIGFSFIDGEIQLDAPEVGNLTWNESLKVASHKLPEWKQVVAECCQVVLEYQGRLENAEEKVESLSSEAHQFQDSESRIKEKLREQQRYSENLANELGRAESEATKSAKEISEISEAFAATKRELSYVSHLLADQRNLKEKTDELIAEREYAEARVVEMSNTLVVLEEKLKKAAGESANLEKQMQQNEEANHQLESKNASLDRKCERLRDYIRKLTNKCEEWADYAEKQTEVIRQAKDRQRRADKKVEQEQTTHDTPHALQQSKERSQWSVERKMLHRVNNLVDKDDLDELASELRNFGLK